MFSVKMEGGGGGIEGEPDSWLQQKQVYLDMSIRVL